MQGGRLHIYEKPAIESGRMLIGLSGWMDGGDVSTGAIHYLLESLQTTRIAEIDPLGFYIYNFPGSMELSTLFRPDTTIENGIVTSYNPPRNRFHYNAANRLVLFSGKEPNLRWEEYTDLVLNFALRSDIRRICFLGSYAGVVPHTRDPRLYTTASTKEALREMETHGLKPSNYQGPAGIVTHLMVEAARRNMEVVSLVAEIPAYLQGRNPRCIGVVVRRLAAMLGLDLDLEPLAEESRTFEATVAKIIHEKEELADMVQKLEAEYDRDYLDTEMGDLRQWLEDQGFPLP